MVSRLPVAVKSFVPGLELDGLQLLQRDHMKVEMLFVTARAARNETQKKKFITQICNDLDTHARIEETVFYPACEKFDELRDIIADSRQEHMEIKRMVQEIRDSLKTDLDGAMNKLNKLMKNVAHHVSDEENELFPKVRHHMGRAEFERISNQIRGRKEKKPVSKAA